MKVIDTKFKGLKIIQQKRIGDSRGNLRETFRKKIIKWDNLIFDYATTAKMALYKASTKLPIKTKFIKRF